ncbi:MAG: enoyl-CoA hydratase/isomerase family protein [Caldilineales bacterium]|nr:enoyl-CoA hydratase/isomerase family protein [Caldilineales bacterium]
MSDYEHIGFTIQDGVATITLNRPDRLNSLTQKMTRELLDAIKVCGRDDAIRAVVVTGAGKGFCAGQDLAEFQEAVGTTSVSEHLQGGFNRIVLSLYELEKPVIASVNGVAAGAGLGVVLACDLRIASEKASFTAAFIGIGLVPDSGVSWFLHRQLGPARAFEFLVTGERLSAAQALGLGLVNRVATTDDLESATQELAARLAQGPTRGIGLTKRVLHRAASLDLAQTLAYEALSQDIAHATADHREGVAAFLEKRPPQFKGV